MNATDKTNFPPAGFNVWFPGANPWPRSVHSVSEETRRWDGTEFRHAIYSDLHDVFGYCAIRITGRAVRWGTDGVYRLTVRVDFENEQNVLGEMLLPVPFGTDSFFTIEAARAALTN